MLRNQFWIYWFGQFSSPSISFLFLPQLLVSTAQSSLFGAKATVACDKRRSICLGGILWNDASDRFSKGFRSDRPVTQGCHTRYYPYFEGFFDQCSTKASSAAASIASFLSWRCFLSVSLFLMFLLILSLLLSCPVCTGLLFPLSLSSFKYSSLFFSFSLSLHAPWISALDFAIFRILNVSM